MKKIGFAPTDPNEDDQESKPNINEQIVASYIDENYEVYGEVEQKEFRTTVELVIELREMVIASMTTINKLLKEKGFCTIFIEGVSYWIMYEKRRNDIKTE